MAKKIGKIFTCYVSPDWSVVETLCDQKKTILIKCSEYSDVKKKGLVEITIK